jgi:hypothetical protein
METSTTPALTKTLGEDVLVDLFPIDPVKHRIRRRPLFKGSPTGWRAYYHYQVLYSDPQLQWERKSWWRRLFSLRRY